MFIQLVFCTFVISVPPGCKSSGGPKAKKEREQLGQRERIATLTNALYVC